MAKVRRPIVPAGDPPPAPLVTPPASSAPSARADLRSTQAAHVRATVRRQLAHSQRRRQELSHALGALRRDLREMRTQVRTRLREMSYHATSRRPALAKAAAAAAAASAPLIMAPEPPVVTLPVVAQPGVSEPATAQTIVPPAPSVAPPAHVPAATKYEQR